MGDIKIILGLAQEKLLDLPDNSVDSVVTDPPYELGFMGKKWDSSGIAFNVQLWEQVLRVLKPGGYLLSFGGTRTFHRMVCAIEDAGFEIRDMIEWVYGSGFPKSLDIGKAIDKSHGNEREVIGYGGTIPDIRSNNFSNSQDKKRLPQQITKGGTKWEGWGTALKPAHEPICVARKPLSEKTVAENVLRYGTGGINIDGARVNVNPDIDDMSRNVDRNVRKSEIWKVGSGFKNENNNRTGVLPSGRFPSNLIHDGSQEVIRHFPEQKSGAMTKPYNYTNNGTSMGKPFGKTKAIHESNSGSAARFFKTCEFTEDDIPAFIYCAKASRSERDEGMDKNYHPTVKPITLMRYLIRLITPPDGIVLDPFSGSGTTLAASVLEGFMAIGIESDEQYIPIIQARINNSIKSVEINNQQIKLFE